MTKGRPKEEKPRDKTVATRLTTGQFEVLKNYAHEGELGLSEWLYKLVLWYMEERGFDDFWEL